MSKIQRATQLYRTLRNQDAFGEGVGKMFEAVLEALKQVGDDLEEKLEERRMKRNNQGMIQDQGIQFQELTKEVHLIKTMPSFQTLNVIKPVYQKIEVDTETKKYYSKNPTIQKQPYQQPQPQPQPQPLPKSLQKTFPKSTPEILHQINQKQNKINEELSQNLRKIEGLVLGLEKRVGVVEKGLGEGKGEKGEKGGKKDLGQELKENQERILREIVMKVVKVDNWAELSLKKQLNIQGAGLSRLPEDLYNLTQLTKLYASQNPLTPLPKTLSNLPNLQKLHLNQCSLTSSHLPQSLSQLSNLNSLQLMSNKFTQIPTCILKLPNLQYLNFRNNQISRLPSGLFDLPLVQLQVSCNQLTDLFGDVVRLGGLRKLAIQGNLIAFLPRVLIDMKRLDVLEMSKKQLKESKQSIQEFDQQCRKKGISITWLI